LFWIPNKVDTEIGKTFTGQFLDKKRRPIIPHY